MRWLVVISIMLATALPGLAEDWTTADGKTYKNVVVVAQEDDGVRITYTGGVGKIPYYELSLDLQKRFGQDYDSLEAKRKAAEKALADATRNADAAAAAAAAQKKQQDEEAAAQAKTQPGGITQSGGATHPGAPPSPNGRPIQPSGTPATASAAPPPSPYNAEEETLYPGSKFSYITVLDVCYLDSPPVEVWPVLPEAAPTASNSPSPDTSIILRIATDGHRPETPDKIEATFLSTGTVKELPANRNIKFLVDGAYIPVDAIESDDGSFPTVAGPVTETVYFDLSPDQARSIFNGKNVNFSIGSDNYRIDQAGIATFRRYFEDVSHLPPASTNFIRSYHKFIARLPSIITIISTVCEYIILGGFGLLTAATIAAFVLGMSRFLKW